MTVVSRIWRCLLVLAVLLLVAFGAIAPPEGCPSVTTADLQRSTQAAVGWFVRNQYPNGTWLYEYRRDSDASTPRYNDVRHAGAVMALYQAAEAGHPSALRAADRGASWALDRVTQRVNWSAVTVNGTTTTGATALLVAGLDYRRAATGDDRYDDVMRRLGRFLVEQVEPSGAVLAFYDTSRDRPVPGEYSKYYTGETYWALALLARTFPDEHFAKTASASARTSQPSATTRRATGPRSPTTGPNTECPRRRPSARPSWPTPAARPSSGQARRAGSRNASAPGEPSSADPTCSAAAGTAS